MPSSPDNRPSNHEPLDGEGLVIETPAERARKQEKEEQRRLGEEKQRLEIAKAQVSIAGW
jgi:hypothetical protein